MFLNQKKIFVFYKYYLKTKILKFLKNYNLNFIFTNNFSENWLVLNKYLKKKYIKNNFFFVANKNNLSNIKIFINQNLVSNINYIGYNISGLKFFQKNFFFKNCIQFFEKNLKFLNNFLIICIFFYLYPINNLNKFLKNYQEFYLNFLYCIQFNFFLFYFINNSIFIKFNKIYSNIV